MPRLAAWPSRGSRRASAPRCIGLAGITSGRLGGFVRERAFRNRAAGHPGLDWRTAIYVFTIGGLLFAPLFFFLFRNSPHEHPWVNDAETSLTEGQPQTKPPRMTFGQMLASLQPRALFNLTALSVQSLISTIADNIYSSWIPLFLAEVHHLKYERMGIYSALPLLGGAIAGLTGGLLNDWLIAKTGNRRWSRSGIAIFGKSVAAIVLLVAMLWYDSPYVFCWLLFVVKLFGDWSLTTSWGVVTDIGGRATASVFAFSNAIAGIGFIAAPALFGYLAQYHGWPAVFFTVAGLYALCALSWLFIDCTIPVIREADEH
jgi:MFS family permease